MESGFFNSQMTGTDGNGNPVYDRTYDAGFLTSLLKSVVPNGVTEGSFVPSRGEDLSVNITSGQCFINGCFGNNIFEYSLMMSSTSKAHTDYIVLRLDNTNRAITLNTKYDDPTLTRTSGIYELAIASVFIEAFADSLGENAVTDLRNNSDKCGIISFGGSGSASLGSFSLPQNADDTAQNKIVVRGANGVISGTVKNSQTVNGIKVTVSQTQPSSPSSGDLWFW